MKTSHKRWLLVVISFLLAACEGMPAKLGTPVTASVPAGTGRDISASACGFQLLLVIPINVNSRLQRATAVLEREAHGDFITDVKVQERWTYGFVGTQYCTDLQAKAIPQDANNKGADK